MYLALFTLLIQDRILVGVHQTGAVSAESKQTPFLEVQLSRPLSPNLTAWGRIQIAATPQPFTHQSAALFNQLAQSAEFQTGLALRLHSYQGHQLSMPIYFGAAAHFQGARTFRQYAAGFRITGPAQSVYQATLGQDQQVTNGHYQGVVLRFELTHPIANTPLFFVAGTNLRLTRPGPQDSYRLGLALELSKWFLFH